MTTHIVGIDCATKHQKVGVARATIENGQCKIVKARCCTAKETAASIIAGWHKASRLSLLALDAPLGWPSSLGTKLGEHEAGNHIDAKPDKLFHRMTDDAVKDRLDKRPLEVGANLIARTAKAALDLLHELRRETGEIIPLAWEMRVPERLSAIEVYPAATRLSLYPDVASRADKRDDRRQMIQTLAKTTDVSQVSQQAEESEHVFDALLCVVAAFEFINGRCVEPKNHEMALAKKEGWIWVGPKAITP